MTINRLHDDIERGIEAAWARQQDAEALQALRKKMEAEVQMSQNVAALKDKNGQA